MVRGSKWVKSIDVTAGDVYILYINNYSISSTSFNLSWNLTNGASLNCSTLPVKIANLSGQKTETGNLITWETSSEDNSNTFEVQRSLETLKFETIKTLKAAGHSQQSLKYSHLDESCRNKGYYYRLKETDINGIETFSNIIYIDSENDVNLTRVYPVPAHDLISVDIESRLENDVMIEVVNSIGNSVYSRHQLINQGNNTVMVDVSDLSAGMYFVRITNKLDSYRVQNAFVK